jgi:hypothetical protein
VLAGSHGPTKNCPQQFVYLLSGHCRATPSNTRRAAVAQALCGKSSPEVLAGIIRLREREVAHVFALAPVAGGDPSAVADAVVGMPWRED